MAFRQHDFQAIRKRHAFKRRQLYVWRRADFGEFRTVRARARRLILRIGHHFELIESVAEPAPRRIAQILSRRFAHAVQRSLVLLRISREYLAASEDVGFPAKASDGVEPAREISFIGCLEALTLCRLVPVPAA